MEKITVKIEDRKARLYTPFSSEFVSSIKKIGGAKWNSNARCWEVPAEALDSARKIMKAVYGYTDLPDNGKLLKLRLTFKIEVSEVRASVVYFGKTIATAWGRDSGARCGEDVVFEEKNPTSGGSMRNWRSIVAARSVVILRNVPECLYRSEIEKIDADDVTVELLGEEAPTISKEALLEEKERLAARLAEIEAQLAMLDD